MHPLADRPMHSLQLFLLLLLHGTEQRFDVRIAPLLLIGRLLRLLRLRLRRRSFLLLMRAALGGTRDATPGRIPQSRAP